VTPDREAAERAGAAFAERFGAEPAGVWAAPGRVNVIGEHTDYNGGLVLPIALEHTTRAAVGRRDDGVLALVSLQERRAVELPLDDLGPGTPGGWAGYPAGVVHELRTAVTAAGGLSVLVDSDLPLGAGLSSSAALECAVALGVRDLLGLDLTAEDLVEVARRAENDFVGAPTGILDQSAALLCEAGHALFLDTRDRRAEQVPFDLSAAGLALLVVDSGVRHQHAGGGYGDRRRECEQAAARLGVASLRDVDLTLVTALDDGSRRGRGCCGGPGTSSPRTPGCSTWSRRCAGTPTRGRSARSSPRGTRRCATSSRSRCPSSTRSWPRRWRPARTAPGWSAAASAAARSRWSTPAPSTR
jgi:galactokinase